MFTLQNFYTSDKWRGLVDRLKMERLNADGDLICEHCGQPIVRKYDCIGHHVVELTDENVNNYTVSLNPENVKLIHFRCHNEIHQRNRSRRVIKAAFTEVLKENQINGNWDFVFVARGKTRYVKSTRLALSMKECFAEIGVIK